MPFGRGSRTTLIRSWVLGNEAHENRNGVLLFILLCREHYNSCYERKVNYYVKY